MRKKNKKWDDDINVINTSQEFFEKYDNLFFKKTSGKTVLINILRAVFIIITLAFVIYGLI